MTEARYTQVTHVPQAYWETCPHVRLGELTNSAHGRHNVQFFRSVPPNNSESELVCTGPDSFVKIQNLNFLGPAALLQGKSPDSEFSCSDAGAHDAQFGPDYFIPKTTNMKELKM